MLLLFIVNLKRASFCRKGFQKEDTIRVNYEFTGPMELRGANLVNDEVDEPVNKDAYCYT